MNHRSWCVCWSFQIKDWLIRNYSKCLGKKNFKIKHKVMCLIQLWRHCSQRSMSQASILSLVWHLLTWLRIRKITRRTNKCIYGQNANFLFSLKYSPKNCSRPATMSARQSRPRITRKLPNFGSSKLVGTYLQGALVPTVTLVIGALCTSSVLIYAARIYRDSP